MSTEPSHRNFEVLEKLDRGLQYKLVLYVAPAGTGKAQVIQDWIDLSENILSIKPLCLELESEDNLPVIFLGKLIENFQDWDPDIEHFGTIQHINNQFSIDEIEPVALSDSGIQPSIENLLNELINRLMHLAGERYLIMLNYHLIENPGIQSIVAYLIDYFPHNLHIVIPSQFTPPLQIPRLRARRELLEIFVRDL